MPEGQRQGRNGKGVCGVVVSYSACYATRETQVRFPAGANLWHQGFTGQYPVRQLLDRVRFIVLTRAFALLGLLKYFFSHFQLPGRKTHSNSNRIFRLLVFRSATQFHTAIIHQGTHTELTHILIYTKSLTRGYSNHTWPESVQNWYLNLFELRGQYLVLCNSSTICSSCECVLLA